MRSKYTKLKKELGLLDVYAIATGATLSAGFFLLPGMAAELLDGIQGLGGLLALAYLVAALPLIPATLCKIELATAMPRAGGVYYFLDRTMGPMLGTIGGIGTWLALMLKVSFALVGMGVYSELFFPDAHRETVAIGVAVFLTAINLAGAKKSGNLQIVLVAILLTLLAIFFGSSIIDPTLDWERLRWNGEGGLDRLIATSGFVYISYVGVTKVCSVAEEVRSPDTILPQGVLLSLATVIFVYGVGIALMGAIVPPEELVSNWHLPATAAEKVLGRWGKICMSAAALLAFVSVANAGMLSASRYPMAMSRDHIFPALFGRVSPAGIPRLAVLATSAVVILLIVFLDPLKIAKLASAFQLVLFAMVCLGVIVMRESGLESYDPGFRVPGYPWIPLLGAALPLVYISAMGTMVRVFSLGLVLVGFLWYRFYVRHQVTRTGAVFHMFERWGQNRFDGLDRELRGILKEKGLREQDPFDDIVARAQFLDWSDAEHPEQLVEEAAARLAQRINVPKDPIVAQLQERELRGETPVTHGVALPHVRVKGLQVAEMVLARVRNGVDMSHPDIAGSDQPVHAFFFLASPMGDAGQHLRILAQLAERVDSNGFMESWLGAHDELEVKEVLLHDDRLLSLFIEANGPTQGLIGMRLRDLHLPEETLVALIRRNHQIVIPSGSTTLEVGDRLTVIGSVKGVRSLSQHYLVDPTP